MQVEQKVPVTRVARVSEMRTVGSIADDALILIVQNGTGSKTTFGQLKRQILAEAKDTAESFAAEAATLATNKSAVIASDLKCLSGNIFKKEVPELQRNMNAVDGKLARLSADLAKNVKEAFDFGKETREMLVQCNIREMKQKDSKLEATAADISAKCGSIERNLAKQQNEQFLSVENTLLGINADIEALSGYSSRLQKSLTKLSSLVESTIDTEKLQSTIDEFDARLFGLKVKKIVDSREEIEVIEEGEIDKLKSDMKRLQNCIADLSGRLEVQQ